MAMSEQEAHDCRYKRAMERVINARIEGGDMLLTDAFARGRREAAAIAEIYREALLGKRTGECPCCGVKDGGHDPICELVPAEEYMEALTANTEVSDGS